MSNAVHSSLKPRFTPLTKTDGTLSPRRRAAQAKYKVLLAKSASKIRDYHRCQYPGCPVRGVGRVESMHLSDAGMGGNPDGTRGWQQGDYVTGCHEHHQGPRSVHTHHVEMRPATAAGGDGLVHWYRREALTAPFVYVGPSRPQTSTGAVR